MLKEKDYTEKFSYSIAERISAEYGITPNYLYEYHPRNSRPRTMMIALMRLRDIRCNFIKIDLDIYNTQISRAVKNHWSFLEKDTKYKQVFDKIQNIQI